ncbi:MAG: LytR/AlgR family response regulator transcription factor [Terriglobia bacterium]
MKALLVDDERLARTELRRLLRVHPDITVVGEAQNVAEAEARLQDPSVELVFLDIQMPGGSGFGLLERLDRVPLVIFTTAYDVYAVKAFEVNALDYLLKPVVPERLAAALDRARQAFKAAVAGVATGGAAAALPGRVFLREGEQCWIVNLAEIKLLESEGNYTRIYFGNHRPLIPKSLRALEARLDPALFFRASRSHILNLRWVAGIEAAIDGGLNVTLRDGPQVAVSRRQSRWLRENFSF